ncbi:neuronal acetylcholine receptor subunit beta-4-like, partial [Saccostrea cucullata]|uniref:neuronal acetylcholine receptor subunit beta-4-like n=1 Tax=Saccostrea cuccullata TaxID=36930 RepID=UPI002ED093F4
MTPRRTIFLVVLILRTAFCADVRLLEKKLLENYSSIIKPRRDQTQSVLVNLTFTMNSLRNVEERYQYITFMGWFIVTWFDDFLSWNEKEFVGLKSVNIPYTKVWVPDISLYFSETNTHDLGVNPFVSVYSNGLVFWYPGDHYTVECLLDIQKFPFDKQACELRIAAWQTTDWMQKLIPKRRPNEMKQISENGEWEFIRTDLRSVFVPEFNMTEVRYTLFLQRRPLYALVSTVFPVVLLAALNSLAYSLPVTSGERMTYCLTILLAFTVFLTLFEENMPRKSTNIPYLSLYLCAHLISSVLSIFISIIVIRSSHMIIKAADMLPIQTEDDHPHAYENKGFEHTPQKTGHHSLKDQGHDKNFNMESKNLEHDRNVPEVEIGVMDK